MQTMMQDPAFLEQMGRMLADPATVEQVSFERLSILCLMLWPFVVVVWRVCGSVLCLRWQCSELCDVLSVYDKDHI